MGAEGGSSELLLWRGSTWYICKADFFMHVHSLDAYMQDVQVQAWMELKLFAKTALCPVCSRGVSCD